MGIEIKTPLSEEKIADLTVGDVVYISGTIFTARDRAHSRILEEGAPYDMKGSIIFHAGPIIQMNDQNSENTNSKKLDAKMVAVGPTTSTRMNPFQPQVLDKGVKAIIGKGGMDERTSKALMRNKSVYLAAVGGCAALYVNTIKKIKNVYWIDLGVPEAIWEIEVEKFGPLVVAMDSKGANLYEDIKRTVASRKINKNK